MSESIALFLKAENPARNCRRGYAIAVDRDLFGTWCVSLAWGRIGTGGAGKMLAFEDRGAALAFARRQLRRRLKSERRIGVPYRLTNGIGPVADLRDLFLSGRSSGPASRNERSRADKVENVQRVSSGLSLVQK